MKVYRRRNTPTCVGKTFCAENSGILGEKHPHVRGEDVNRLIGRSHELETPPRAWGRRPIYRVMYCNERNTPTCVGKTPGCVRFWACSRKHPHVRGEDDARSFYVTMEEETPPRAWGRRSL